MWSPSLLLVASLLLGAAGAAGTRKTYIVHMQNAEESGVLRRSLISASLDAASVDADHVLYTYQNTLNGYAAKITDEQADALRAQPGVLSVRPDHVYQLQTTRTPAFLGLENSALLGRDAYGVGPESYLEERDGLNGTSAESNLVVGVFDGGIWPESASFSDEAMPPIPAHWKGACEPGPNFTTGNCNRKIIGARIFYKGFVAGSTEENGGNFTWDGITQSPRDDDGHGTHCASTAAGAVVPNASIFGQAAGTARGVAPGARIAVYKVCWGDTGCWDSDVLAAMDQAIEDGVDVMSLSFGAPEPQFIPDEGLVVGSYAAMRKGIFVVSAAGNAGPSFGTTVGLAPWALTVAANTLDRDFPAHLTLGNGKTYTGYTLYTNGSVADEKPLTDGEVFPLIHGADASNGNSTSGALCLSDSLDPAKVAGKVVLCVRGQNRKVEKGVAVKAAGGRGMILVNPPANGDNLVPDAYLLPAMHLNKEDGPEVEAYAKAGGGTAILDFPGTRVGVPAPVMAAFSSRGPNIKVPQLLKPDITGPGVSILAAWIGNQGPSSLAEDARKVDFNIISGTSMSTPHLAGIALFLKARRPDWSHAAIRSAIMTTAYTTTKGTQSPLLDYANSQPASPFHYGSGHVDPVAALDPGLVYDIAPDDYVGFLCAVNSTLEFVTGMTRSNATCDKKKTYSAYDLNYPSLSVLYSNPGSSDGAYTVKIKRIVTNVGGPSTYTAAVSLNDAKLVKVSVEPETLEFSAAGEKKSYELTVTMSSPPSANATSWGRLVWTDGKHIVGSPLSFVWGV
ncbi:PA domain-containing protein [Colletotrichum navitas]|uniref:PA domain-containing protein n=1 Tax=Colletotrichum navitas TaxID=681940 RepID=A0AAD8PSV6_9PEZI|nr:PA domain-containing protein [Colletotrichum navitas]KAK1579612.1 PA domain-containing protein [Colletotrichum navitas]